MKVAPRKAAIKYSERARARTMISTKSVGLFGLRHWKSNWLKWALILSVVANIYFWLSSSASQGKGETPKELETYTHQPVENANKLSPNASKESVVQLLGLPVVKEFNANTEEWHYCTTGKEVDQYLSLTFKENQLYSLHHYTVNWLDIYSYYTQKLGKIDQTPVTGDCRLFVRWGTYEQKFLGRADTPPSGLAKQSAADSTKDIK